MLDSLQAAEKDAFARKQALWEQFMAAKNRANDAYQTMQALWDERTRARDIMNQEFECMQRSASHFREVWDNYGRIRDRNNAEIERKRAEADYEHSQMQDCFREASLAYECGDRSMAPNYSSEGHMHKNRRNILNAEISELAREVKEARSYAESVAPKTDNSAFNRAKEAFNQAKSRHEAAQREFKSLAKERDAAKRSFDEAQNEHKRAKEAFQNRLSEVRSRNKRERERILDRADISWFERDTAKIVKKPDGSIQVYHGGIGEGDGLGHGHTALDSFGNKTYQRKSFEEHGAQNYVDGTYKGTFEGKPAIIKISDSGNSNQMQIYYGGKGKPDGPGHNHVNYVNEKLQFWREDGVVIYQDDKNTQINNL